MKSLAHDLSEITTRESTPRWGMECASWPQLLGRTDVWHASWEELRRFMPSYGPLLAPGERERAARLRTEASREAFTLRRGFLRLLLSHYLGERPTAFTFLEPAGAKPTVCGIADFDFSVSSSGNMACIALSRGRRVGVDIESISPNFDYLSVAQSFFPAEETSRLETLPEEAARLAFYSYWTRKEAYLKACGAGIGGLGRNLQTPLDADYPLHSVRPGGSQVRSGWRFASLNAGPQDPAVLCAEWPIGAPMAFCSFPAIQADQFSGSF